MFRRPLALALAAVAAFGVAPARAAEPLGTPKQTVSGTVAVPNPTKAAQIVSRHMRSTIFVGAQTNGAVSWFFKVDPATWGGEFTLTTPAADADYDLILYSDPGSILDAASASAEFLGSSGTGERGLIPAGTTYAVVYPAAGVNTAFTYVGRMAPEIALGADALDLEIPLGGTVRWVNRTADYAFVRGEVEGFDSGTGAGRGIPVEGSYAYTFTEPGAFAYTSSAGAGTITVRD